MATVNTSNVSVASNTTESCVLVDTFAFSHYSAAVAAIILVFLSLFEKRTSRRFCRDDKDCTGGRPGLLIPVNFLSTGRDRWSYAYALGASTNMCLLLFINAFQDQASGWFSSDVSTSESGSSAWMNQLIAIASAVEVGLCFFPFLACLKTRYRLIGAPIGLGYSIVWLAVTVLEAVQCIGTDTAWEDSSILSTSAPYMGLLWSLPVILCLSILVVKFTILMVVSIKSWYKEGCVSLVDKKSERIAQDSDFLYVRTLLMKKEPPEKLPWYRRCCRRRPDDGFRFSARMATTMVVSLLCLYEFAVFEMQSVGVSLQVLRRIYLNFTQSFLEINGQVIVGADTVVSVDNLLLAMQVSWMVSGSLSFLIHVVFVFVIMGAYKKHIRLLYRGDVSWLPENYEPSTANSIKAGMKYSGSQIAFILWGFIIQQVTFLFICAAVYVCVLYPELLLWLLDYFGPVTAVSLCAWLFQFILARVLFSQKKINKKDDDLPLAIDNRRLYHITSYFLFFFNLMVGFFSSIWRLLLGGFMGAMLQARIDHSVLMRILENWDSGFKSYLGMLRIEVAHTHPVLLVFCQHLVDATESKTPKATATTTSIAWSEATKDDVKVTIEDTEMKRDSKDSEDSRLSPTRFKWFVIYTIFRNPSIINSRRKIIDMQDTEKDEVYKFLIERILASKATGTQEVDVVDKVSSAENVSTSTNSQQTSRTSQGKSTQSLSKVD